MAGMRCLTRGLTALALTCAGAAAAGAQEAIVDGPDPTAQCTTTDGQAVVNTLLATLTPVLNKAWPTLAVNEGVDPLTDVFDGSVEIGCSNGGDELCLTTETFPLCDSFYADVDVSAIQGLANVEFMALSMTSLSATLQTPGNPVPPCPSGSESLNYLCGYAGDGNGSAYLLPGTVLSATLSSLEIKAKCTNEIDSQTFTFFKGSAQCTGTDPSGHGDFKVCAGQCMEPTSLVPLISYTALSSLDLDLRDVSCNVSGSGDSITDEIKAPLIEALTPLLASTIVDAIEDPIKDALNDLVEEVLPFPTSCPPYMSQPE